MEKSLPEAAEVTSSFVLKLRMVETRILKGSLLLLAILETAGGSSLPTAARIALRIFSMSAPLLTIASFYCLDAQRLTRFANVDRITSALSPDWRISVPFSHIPWGRIMVTIAKKRSKTKQKRSEEQFTAARERLYKKRLKRERETHWAHFWDVCPKCGGDMFEQKANSILFEVCRKCHGIYIDKAELDLARRFLDNTKFLGRLARKAAKPRVP